LSEDGAGVAHRVDQHLIVVDMHVARLLFVASVDESRKLVCQAPGCGRAIARAVHVIRELTGAVRVIGSGCYGKLSGHEQATKDGAAIAGFDGRRLTPKERALLIADTAAFVASVEALLAAERQAMQQAEESMQADAQRLRGQRTEAAALQRLSREEWNQQVGDGPEAMPIGERAHALDKLSQFRAQQARLAARAAMQRWPELSTHSLDVVADAMTRAKAEYLARGHRMDAPDARSVIEAAAVATLAERARRGGAR
jgi:hypothetical protein